MSSTSKFKVGDKVRILDVEAIDCGASYWVNGDVLEVVTISDSDLPRLSCYAGDTYGLIVLEREFHAIERISPLSKKRRIEALEKDVARQETELEELRAKIEAMTQDRATRTAKSLVKVCAGGGFVEVDGQPMFVRTSLTPNQQRAQIIADAKGFVEQTIEDARGEDGDIVVPDPLEIGNPWCCREIKFEVNAEKRSVVALAIGICDGKVVEKAIAKCAPDDVFNADIGKAIAVGRLFGLDVERFINAPKPTEIVVGQRVTLREDHVFYGNLPENGYAVGKIEDGNAYDADTSDGEGWIPVELLKILDDTEAQYE